MKSASQEKPPTRSIGDLNPLPTFHLAKLPPYFLDVFSGIQTISASKTHFFGGAGGGNGSAKVVVKKRSIMSSSWLTWSHRGVRFFSLSSFPSDNFP